MHEETDSCQGESLRLAIPCIFSVRKRVCPPSELKGQEAGQNGQQNSRQKIRHPDLFPPYEVDPNAEDEHIADK